VTQDEMKRAVIDAACALVASDTDKDSYVYISTASPEWQRLESAVTAYLEHEDDA